MKTTNMKKNYTFKVFFICSVHDSLKLTELYFSGTEAAEPKKSSQLPLNMDQFEKILYIQKIILIHSVTTTTYYITSSVCLLRISAALCLAWKQKKKHSTKSIKIFLSTALNVNHKNQISVVENIIAKWCTFDNEEIFFS